MVSTVLSIVCVVSLTVYVHSRVQAPCVQQAGAARQMTQQWRAVDVEVVGDENDIVTVCFYFSSQSTCTTL